ncbi:hypothetical protein M9Y10_039178 [Tritrichomonas musculus]|uniref:Ubiquitin carboxyl-terminal hydrolase n=1 Tax=Tritrichomonas musculus TaxID=1915356 RepID=A0ABR2KB41_9EUKA
MTIPPPSQQVSIIRNLEKTTKLTPNEPAYLISSKWFNTWKIAVGFSNFQPKDIVVTDIDNNDLLDGDSIRPGTAEGLDYDIITMKVWDKLHNWYNGGPEIKIPVEYDDVEKRNVAVVRKPVFQIYYRDGRRPFPYSIYQKIGDLKEIACKSFECDPKRTRLCDFDGRIRNTALDDTKTLKYYHITNDDHYLLLESQQEDGTWITVTHNTIAPSNSTPIHTVTFNSNSSSSSTANSIPSNDGKGILLNSSSSMQTIVENASEPGICGIMNIGNSCYINAALQCLCHTQCVCDFFLKDEKWRQQINHSNKKGTDGEVTEKFYEVMQELWNGNNNKISSGPRELKFTIGHLKANQFSDTSQQDSHEFLMILMDIMHEDLNRINPLSVPKDLESVYGDGTNDLETAEKSWERHKKINDSFFVDNFHGLLRSRMICPKCHKTTIVFDPFMSLTIPLPIPRTLSPRFTFVPYDLTQPRVEMQLSVVSPATVLEYVEELSQRLKRKISDIVFAERAPNSMALTWRQSISAQGAPCFAYELPPHGENSVFACARLVASKQIKETPAITELDGIFLVELPSEDATEEDVQIACEKRFQPFWHSTPGGEADILSNPFCAEFHSSLCKDTKNSFKEGEKMKARPKVHPLIELRFDRERHLKSVSSTPIEVVLNPDVIKDPSNFDWSMLHKKVIDSSETEIEKRKKVTLEECFKIFQHDDVLDVNNKWHCPHCNQFVCANKKMDVWKSPEILIVHLKRFLHTASSHLKLDINVKYPSVLDMTSYINAPKPADEEVKYNLFGVIEHIGSMSGGHYTAHCYHHIKKKWFFFNDDVVKPARPAAAHNKEGYVLFYLRSNDHSSKKFQKEKINVTEEMKKQMFMPKIILPVVNLEQKQTRKLTSKIPMRSQSAASTGKINFNLNDMRNNLLRVSKPFQQNLEKNDEQVKKDDETK